MKTTTSTTLPSVNVLSKYIDRTDKKSIQFRFVLLLSYEGRTIQTNFSSGILGTVQTPLGLRKGYGSEERYPLAKDKLAFHESMKALGCKPVRTIHDEQQNEKAIQYLFERSTVTPEAIAYALISDSQAGADSFADFCDNFGEDEDSRKAFATWEACVKIKSDFSRLIGSRQKMEEIEKALEDY